MSSIKIQNESHWHELRKQNVGASDSPALFNLLPWLTHWQLWMEKAGKLPARELAAVKHIKAGKYFEPAIAGLAAEKWGVQLNKVRRYLIADDCPGMGASLDYEQIGTGERIPTEIKWVVGRSDSWEYDGDEITMAPDYYLVQVQHQLGCSNDDKGQLIAFINGDLRRAIYPRREKMIQTIKANVRRFWFDIEQGNEPAIDFKADAEAVMRYAALMPMRQIEWDKAVADLASSADYYSKQADDMEALAKAKKAELAYMMVDRAVKDGMNDPEAKIVCEGAHPDNGVFYRVTRYYVGPTTGKEITRDMIGLRIGARAGFPVCKVSTPKPKAAKKGKRHTKPVDSAESERTPSQSDTTHLVQDARDEG